MTKVNDTEIYSILPYSIRNDQKVKDLCGTLDKILMPLAEEAKMALVYSRIDVLPEDILDLLAWQLHVDTYDTAAEISIKREQVRQSISLHKKEGLLMQYDLLLKSSFLKVYCRNGSFTAGNLIISRYFWKQRQRKKRFIQNCSEQFLQPKMYGPGWKKSKRKLSIRKPCM